MNWKRISTRYKILTPKKDCLKNVGLYFKIILAYGYRLNAIIWFGIYPVDNEMNRNEMDADEPEKEATSKN